MTIPGSFFLGFLENQVRIHPLPWVTRKTDDGVHIIARDGADVGRCEDEKQAQNYIRLVQEHELVLV